MLNRSLRSSIWLYLKRSIKFLGLILVAYVLILAVGLIPVNNDFEPAENGVLIHVTSNAVHADIIVPISISTVDWRPEFSPAVFAGSAGNATHMAFGWGDKGFFIETPTWSDLKVSTAAKALLIPSDCCLHVAYTRVDLLGTDAHPVRLSNDQYERLTKFIEQSFKTDDLGQRIQIQNAAYGYNDAFFEAKGTYHALNTCNSWVGRALKTAGVRVPLLSPMPKSPMLYFPAEE